MRVQDDICVCVCMRVWVRALDNIYVRVCARAHVHVQRWLSLHVCTDCAFQRMYVCMYVSRHTSTQACTHRHMYSCFYEHDAWETHSALSCVCACMYMSNYVFICMCKYIHTRAQTVTHAHIYTGAADCWSQGGAAAFIEIEELVAEAMFCGSAHIKVSRSQCHGHKTLPSSKLHSLNTRTTRSLSLSLSLSHIHTYMHIYNHV